MSTPAESAASSPNKSPTKRLYASPKPGEAHRLRRAAQEAQDLAFRSPPLSHREVDRARSQERRPSSMSGTKWAIPAVRPDIVPLPTTHRAHASPSRSGKAGAVVRTRRQDAWLKFLAFEAAMQICLEALMEGTDVADNATALLAAECRELKESLGIDGLLLEPSGRSEMMIYWDDHEEPEVPEMEFVIASGSTNNETATKIFNRNTNVPEIQHYKDPQEEAKLPPELDATKEKFSKFSLNPTPLQGGTVARARNESDALLMEPTSPCVEVSIVRVVGSPLLEAPGGKIGTSFYGSMSPLQAQRRELQIELRPADVSSNLAAQSILASNGATERSVPLRITADIHHGTIMVELIYNGEHVAAGTIQISELARAAVQGDLLSQQSPRLTAGFLRGLVSNFGRRQEKSSSMVWVRLVDADGADAGDAILAAKVVPAETSLSPSLIDANEYQRNAQNKINNNNNYLDSRIQPHEDPRIDAMKKKTTQTASTRSTLPPFPSAPYSTGRGASHTTATRPTEEENAAMKQIQPVGDDRYEELGQPKKEASVTTMIIPRVDRRGIASRPMNTESYGYLHATTNNVYDTLLEASLIACGYGPSSLSLKGPWAWLIDRYAEKYGVRKEYTRLSYLRYVVRPGIVAPTSLCFETIALELAPLLEQRESSSLSSAEVAMLQHVLEKINVLLATCFENYFSLNEEKPGGMNEMLSMREKGVPAALRPASILLSMTRDMDSGPDGGATWLVSRLRMASRKRFHALLAATEARRGPSDMKRALDYISHGSSHEGINVHSKGDGRRSNLSGNLGRQEEHKSSKTAMVEDPNATSAYARVEELSACVVSELKADDAIHVAGAMPKAIRLPEVTSVEYVRGTVHHLQRVLQRYPPVQPSPIVVQLVEAVVNLQKFVEQHKYEDAANRLNARDIFGNFVMEWIARSSNLLHRQLRALDKNGPPNIVSWLDMQSSSIKHQVAPVVETMLLCVESEMLRYERIVTNWPIFGRNVETSLVQVLRGTMMAASSQCGLIQTKEGSLETGNDAPSFGRVAWRWEQVTLEGIDVSHAQNGSASNTAHNMSSPLAQVPAALRQGLSPCQALLLNSLRRMLAVIPQLEQDLNSWCVRDLPGENKTLVDNGTGSMPSKPFISSPAGAEDLSELGAHWAQLVKELRTRYVACIRLCVESLSFELSSSSSTSIQRVLRRDALVASPNSFSKRFRRVLDTSLPVLRWLATCLDGRVFVALSRGLWDLSARDILRYAEDLTEATNSDATSDRDPNQSPSGPSDRSKGGAWRARKNAQIAVTCLEAFYRSEIATAIGSNLQDRDLSPPQHAQRASALLADNTVDMNVSFDVY